MSSNEVILLAGGDVQLDLVLRPPIPVFAVMDDVSQNGFKRLTSRLGSAYFNFAVQHPRVFKTLNARTFHRNEDTNQTIGRVSKTLKWFSRFHERLINNTYSNRYRFPSYFFPDTEDNIKLRNKLYPYYEEVVARTFDYRFKNKEEKKNFPFLGVRHLMSDADIVFVDLECPLSENPGIRGMFQADPIYAEGLREAGVQVVTVANNHAFDAGEKGFLETLKNLESNDIRYVGGGRNIKEARTPCIVTVKGVRIAFLSYTQISDHGFDDVAGEEIPGVLPFSPPRILEDIKSAKEQSDVLVVSPHWGSHNTAYIHRKQIEYAHEFLDAGADIIVGHHPHVYKGIEIYKGKSVFYSLGNFVFGHYENCWDDNFLAKIYIREKKVSEICLLPISGRGERLYQPVLLTGEPAKRVIGKLTKISSRFGTKIKQVANQGIISLDYES